MLLLAELLCNNIEKGFYLNYVQSKTNQQLKLQPLIFNENILKMCT